MNELQFRKDIITGFTLIIQNVCKECKKKSEECFNCLFYKAASNGHLNTLKGWLDLKMIELQEQASQGLKRLFGKE